MAIASMNCSERAWVKGELVVEPGESHPETYEYHFSKMYMFVIKKFAVINWRPTFSQKFFTTRHTVLL